MNYDITLPETKISTANRQLPKKETNLPPRSLALRQRQSFAELGVEGLFAGNQGFRGKRHGQRNGIPE